MDRDLPSWMGRGFQGTEARLIKARSQLVVGHAFYGALVLKMKIEAGDVDKLTVSEDAITYNEEYIAGLTEPELQGVLAMGLNPIALLHHCRRGERDNETWQRASELASNPSLIKAGFTLPKEANRDMTFYVKSCEEIYQVIYVKKDQDQQGQGGSQGQGGRQGQGNKPIVQVQDAKDPGAAATKSRIETMQAAQSAKAMGDTTEGIMSLAKQLVDEAMPWESLLRDYMERQCKSDYSWARPNKRYIQQGIYLPCMRGVEMGELVIGVDTSGSLSDDWLSRFGGEMACIVDDLKPEKVTVIYCDTKIHRVDEFSRGDEFELKAQGRGGTSFAPVFEYVEREGINPAALVYFTDMCCNRYGTAPDCPVLWLSTGDTGYGIPPFGEVVRLTDGGLVMK